MIQSSTQANPAAEQNKTPAPGGKPQEVVAPGAKPIDEKTQPNVAPLPGATAKS